MTAASWPLTTRKTPVKSGGTVVLDAAAEHSTSLGADSVMSEPFHRHGRPRQIVIVGGGFAGFHAARTLSRLVNRRRRTRPAPASQTEIVLINPMDYFPYLPLLPEVAGGILDPRRVAVPLAGLGSGIRLIPGTVDEVDIDSRRVRLADPEGNRSTVPYDRLLLTVGSVGKLLPVPGVAEHALGFRSIGEALTLRDHLMGQVELAAAAAGAPPGFAQAERDAHRTFVVVGAGRQGGCEPGRGAAVRPGGQGGDPRLPSDRDPRQQDPHRRRLAARRRAFPAGGAAWPVRRPWPWSGG